MPLAHLDCDSRRPKQAPALERRAHLRRSRISGCERGLRRWRRGRRGRWGRRKCESWNAARQRAAQRNDHDKRRDPSSAEPDCERAVGKLIIQRRCRVLAPSSPATSKTLCHAPEGAPSISCARKGRRARRSPHLPPRQGQRQRRRRPSPIRQRPRRQLRRHPEPPQDWP
jgi:hypothetical protein